MIRIITKFILFVVLFSAFGFVFVKFTYPEPRYRIEQELYIVDGKDSVLTEVRYIRKPGYTIGSNKIFSKKTSYYDREDAKREAERFIEKHKTLTKEL